MGALLGYETTTKLNLQMVMQKLNSINRYLKVFEAILHS